MAEPDVGNTGRDLSREPFFWIFFVIAVILALWALTSAGSDDTDASFVGTSTPTPLSDPAPTAVPLPTPEPTPVPAASPAVVELSYAADAITMSGVVPAQAVGQALIAAAGELVAPEAVVSTIEVDAGSSLTGGALVLTGEVGDENERVLVIETFGDLGLSIDDRLVLAGSDQTIAGLVQGNPDLTQFADFLAASGVIAELEEASDEGLTVFAPTNAAIESLDSAAFDELADAEELSEVLRYHTVEGRVPSAQLEEVAALTSRQGESIAVLVTDGVVTVGGATLVGEQLDTTNGIVYVVDAVLLPGTLRTEVALNQIVSLDPILFASGSAVILDESLPVLDQTAAILLENPLGRVEIQGHTDTDGPADVNLELSQDRADAVKAYLVDAGVDESRLTAVGYGETELAVDPEESDEDKAANRRIEFRVS